MAIQLYERWHAATFGGSTGTASDNECLEAIGSWLAAGAPPARRGYQRSQNNFAVRLLGENKKRCSGGDIEEWHVRRRIKDAFRSRAAEAPEPGQRTEKDNLF